MLIKDQYIVSKEAPLITLDVKSVVCVANNGKDNNYTRHIDRRVNFISYDEKRKMRKI